MKKIILGLLIFTAFTTSCSSDDDNGLAVTEQNILGKWYLKGGKVNNGAFQNYIHECETLRDFQEFTSDGVITFNGYDSDCVLQEVEGSNWILDGNTLIVSSFDTDPFLFEDEFIVEKITSNELVLKQNGINEETEEVEVSRLYLTRN